MPQHGGMSENKTWFAGWLLVVAGGLLLLPIALPAAGVESRMNLPQVSGEVWLSAEARLELDSVWGKWASDREYAMTPSVSQRLLEALPAELRDGCREMLSDFEPAIKVERNLGVRVLHAEGIADERTAILAFRCTVHIPELTAYDERPAVLVLHKGAGVLRLLPLAETCENCSDLYHVAYTQKFAAAGGYLAELKVEHTTDNPCCDGGDSHGGRDLLLVAVPEGAKVLTFEKDTDDYNHDDESEDTQTVCKSEVAYERDSNGYLLALNAQTNCTQNGKFAPPIKASRFEWNAGEKRFLPSGVARSL